MPTYLSPIGAVASFQNKNPATTYGIRPSRFTPVAPGPVTNTSTNPRIAALQNKISGHNQWSSQMTAYLSQAQARRAQPQQSQPSVQFQQGSSRQYGTPSNSRYTGPTGGDTSSQYARQLAAQAGGTRGKILNAAVDMFGTPYAWGGGGIGNRGSRGTGKGTENVIGVDCSGLTSYVYGLFGIRLPRYSGAQTTVGVRTSIANAKPGDLVGWAKGGHVAIYAGNGYIIHSARPGTRVHMRRLFNNEKVYAVSLNIPGGGGTAGRLPPAPRSQSAPQQSRGNANQIDQFLAALRRHESGNNYGAINRSGISTASGAYQYIDRTWNNYGGYRRAYMAPRHVQDQRARQDIANLFRRYGNWEQVAAHHFYPAWANRRDMWSRAPSRGNPTVSKYVASVMRGMGG